MKTLLTLTFIVSAFGAIAQHKYFQESKPLTFSYFSRKLVPCEDCRKFTLKGTFPDGSEVCISQMTANCLNPGMWFNTRKLSYSKSEGEYHFDIVFKKLEADHKKRERKKDASGVRLFYYVVPVSAVYEVTVTDKKGEVVLKKELSTNKNVEFPGAAKPQILSVEQLEKEYAAAEWSFHDLRTSMDAEFNKSLKNLFTLNFENDKKDVSVPYFSIRTKDPAFAELISASDKVRDIADLIDDSNKEDVAKNWYTEAIALKADEVLKTLTGYLDPSRLPKFSDPKENSEFERKLRFNIALVKLFASDPEGAAADLKVLKAEITDPKNQNEYTKDIKKAIEELEPVVLVEQQSYPANKVAYKYYR